MLEVHRAVVRYFDRATHKVAVEVLGSPESWEQDVPVGRDVAPEELASGVLCLVALDPETGSSVLLCTHGGTPPSIDMLSIETYPLGIDAAPSLVSVGTAGRVKIRPLYLPGPMSASTIRVHGGTADAVARYVFGLYDRDGKLVVTTGPVAVAAGYNRYVMGAPVQLDPGQYYAAFTGSALTATVASENALPSAPAPRRGYVDGVGGTELPATLAFADIVRSNVAQPWVMFASQ